MKNHFLVYFESENSAKTFGVVCFIDVEKPSMSIGREYQLPFAGHVNQQPAKHPSTREKYLEREGSEQGSAYSCVTLFGDAALSA